MDAVIESFYERIGQQAVEVARVPAEKIVVYSEVEDGMSTCGLFFRAGSRIVYRDCGPLSETIYDFWEHWQTQHGSQEWRAITYVLSNSSFDLHLSYPHEMSKEEDIVERRPRVLKAHFGGVTVDYSDP